MKNVSVGFALLLGILLSGAAAAECAQTLQYNFRVLGGQEEVNLCDRYQGKVVMVVNTASKCAFTEQYAGLEDLYQKYREQGLVVIGFPSNDFANQEPASEQEIKKFCKMTYSVKFPMFEKLHVAASNAHPFYRDLAARAGTYPQWNFHKYLLNRQGELVASFASETRPNDPRVIKALEGLM